MFSQKSWYPNIWGFPFEGIVNGKQLGVVITGNNKVEKRLKKDENYHLAPIQIFEITDILLEANHPQAHGNFYMFEKNGFFAGSGDYICFMDRDNEKMHNLEVGNKLTGINPARKIKDGSMWHFLNEVWYSDFKWHDHLPSPAITVSRILMHAYSLVESILDSSSDIKQVSFQKHFFSTYYYPYAKHLSNIGNSEKEMLENILKNKIIVSPKSRFNTYMEFPPSKTNAEVWYYSPDTGKMGVVYNPQIKINEPIKSITTLK